VMIPTAADGSTPRVTVGVEVGPDARCQFFAAVQPEPPRPFGSPFTATPGRWVGATLGLFAARPPTADAAEPPTADAAEVASLRITGRADEQP
jgi:hypothetical protein